MIHVILLRITSSAKSLCSKLRVPDASPTETHHSAYRRNFSSLVSVARTSSLPISSHSLIPPPTIITPFQSRAIHLCIYQKFYSLPPYKMILNQVALLMSIAIFATAMAAEPAGNTPDPSKADPSKADPSKVGPSIDVKSDAKASGPSGGDLKGIDSKGAECTCPPPNPTESVKSPESETPKPPEEGEKTNAASTSMLGLLSQQAQLYLGTSLLAILAAIYV
ncbi:hypothetical protein PtA15_3A870 [Puccinia triticina]|uniref:Uncharacterized protein n=1 Tax=Puccinia triticina TaxID=208348 RepID=A0ABY7CFN3_9BASI|nr:uncharacterized protein PtA15_3A870 [Puccinia triticina]WAQ83499.1 hypothetical protein PtA15_3A870 [Puccinia triticina]